MRTTDRNTVPSRRWRDMEAATRTDYGDTSTPKFSEDLRHIADVAMANRGLGFPVLNVDGFRRAA